MKKKNMKNDANLHLKISEFNAQHLLPFLKSIKLIIAYAIVSQVNA